MTRLILIPIILLKSFLYSQELIPSGVNNSIINHSNYKIAYSEQNEQAEWVYYELIPSKLNYTISRSNNFRSDLSITTKSANASDYYKSEYDRGHLAPALDMKYSATSMSESFLFSNISPQDPNFNRGVWNRLENQIHHWAVKYNRLVIITGPVLNGDYFGFIGSNKVSIPKYFYKVVIDPSNYSRSIAFLLENKKSSEHLLNFALSIDSLEFITGIDFFYLLDDEEEEAFEQVLNLSIWDWDYKNNASYSTRVSNNHSNNSNTQNSNSNTKTVYTTSSGNKYHTSSCRYLSNSKHTININEAKRIGLVPCSVCRPKNNF